VSTLDWVVLGGWLTFIVLYGLWRGRGSRDLDGYLLAGHKLKWGNVALAIMATQASAVTVLATPGQAYADGMRFVQFYFGLPIAMVVLSATAVPIYRRLRVFTAYEYLETRFDLKTRSLASLLFLTQRGLAAGITIYAPSLILSVLLGWNTQYTILLIGSLVVLYTAIGGTKSVNYTQFLQFLIMISGIVTAGVLAITAMPAGVSLPDALHVAGALDRLRAVDTSFDLQSRYNIWSGLIGGCFLALSYFGCDQSQVGRYLGGQSVAQSRMGLLFNGLAKIPMQFVILLVGALVFAFYQLTPPPAFFNPAEVRKLERGPHAEEFRALRHEHEIAADLRATRAREYLAARNGADPQAVEQARHGLRAANDSVTVIRSRTTALMKEQDPAAQTVDTNYVFLSFVLSQFPAGMVGLLLAAVFAASMSASSAELNALASTTVVDIWGRLVRRRAPGTEPLATGGPEAARAAGEDVTVSRLATVLWGAFAIGFAMMAGQLGSLVEAVNILGSLFYGTILGIFLTGFYFKRIGGTAVFCAALVAEVAVLACFKLTKISFLWYNVVGCVLVVLVGFAISEIGRRSPGPRRPVTSR
jgi:Na+/proline symporter